MVPKDEGMQLLSVEEDGGYRCEESALRRVAGWGGGAARVLPVAVVSVAGATRGGKSFLLDFFLRYLRAPEAARRSGAWLGAEDDPLTGFNWRGGCERHTQGILVWSEPIVINLGPEVNSEKVAVVLLDTQGSFDSSSTLRDSSTVFGLSMLLSSVQVYNLSQNIKEDDLHYLQLFTEYGKLAREQGAEKPFQELWFLVRDWCFAYDHPIGAEGGQQLLDKRLEIRAEQANELREIRGQVRGAFERICGFLMPHPGLTVAASPTFTGCLKDISTDFKNTLLELVPALFAPENLKIKYINGQAVTLQDFAQYFKTYVEIFNSDTLPTPVTVMQATATASLEAALNACREEYVTHMERSAGGACVKRGALPQHHSAALNAARQVFSARRTLAASSLVTARLDSLIQELSTSLADYEAINSGRILKAAARCKTYYEAAMQTDKCLAADELTERHNSAVKSTKKAFYAEFTRSEEDTIEGNDELDDTSEGSIYYNTEYHIVSNGIDDSEEHDNSVSHDDNYEEDERSNEFDDDDEDWKVLEKELAELLPLHRERNAMRIAAAQESAQEFYTERMREAVSSAPCLHPLSLHSLHKAAKDAATDRMTRTWQDANTVLRQYKEELWTCTEDKYSEFKATNDANNETALEEAIDLYRNTMSQISNDRQFLQPSDLEAEHKLTVKAAEEFFLNRRDAASRALPADRYLINLQKGSIPIYLWVEQRNKTRNEEAVKEAHEYYLRHIDPTGGSLDAAVLDRHPWVKQDALKLFKMKRRSSDRIYFQDTYLDDLDKKIETSFCWIVMKFTAGGIATVVGAVAMGAMFFRR